MADGAMKLSVVIPARNEAGSIGETVESSVTELELAGIPYEILVVDDASGDGTAEVVKAIAEGTIEWEQDPDFGYEIAVSVPGFPTEDNELLQPRHRYERTGRLDEYNAIVRRLKEERTAFLKSFPGLDSRIVDAVSTRADGRAAAAGRAASRISPS